MLSCIHACLWWGLNPGLQKFKTRCLPMGNISSPGVCEHACRALTTCGIGSLPSTIPLCGFQRLNSGGQAFEASLDTWVTLTALFHFIFPCLESKPESYTYYACSFVLWLFFFHSFILCFFFFSLLCKFPCLVWRGFLFYFLNLCDHVTLLYGSFGSFSTSLLYVSI